MVCGTASCKPKKYQYSAYTLFRCTLMYAETENYLNNGPTPEAEAALKEVRTRAGVGELPIPTDQQGFEDALVQERKWEFAGEFTLRSDLTRMGRLAKELNQAKQDMKDLSDRKGAYANVPKYRLYKYQEDGQKYGDKFLAIDYIELTDPTEIATVKIFQKTKSSIVIMKQN